MLHEDQLPIDFDPDFLLTLDIDASDKDNKCRLVDRYECAWWNEKKPRTLDRANILDQSSLTRCLDVHKRQLSSSPIDSPSHSQNQQLSGKLPLTPENIAELSAIVEARSLADNQANTGTHINPGAGTPAP